MHIKTNVLYRVKVSHAQNRLIIDIYNQCISKAYHDDIKAGTIFTIS